MVLEGQVSEILIAHLKERKFKTYTEVPMLDNRIDVVAVKPDLREIFAVEVKVRNWKKALQQALVYRLCAHKVFVALWHRHLRAVNTEAFAERGIGILSVDGDVEVVQQPKPSSCIHNSLVMKLQEYLKSKDEWLYG